MVFTLGWVSHDLSSERGIRQATISSQLIHTAFQDLRQHARDRLRFGEARLSGAASARRAVAAREPGSQVSGWVSRFPVDAAPGPAAHT